MKEGLWRVNSGAVADWTRIYAHPNGTIRRYLEIYEKASVV